VGRGCPPPHHGGIWKGGCEGAVPHNQKIFGFLVEKASLGAFWD